MTYQEQWDYLQKKIKDVEEQVEWSFKNLKFYISELKPGDRIAYNGYTVSEIEKFLVKYKASVELLGYLKYMRIELLDVKNKK